MHRSKRVFQALPSPELTAKVFAYLDTCTLAKLVLKQLCHEGFKLWQTSAYDFAYVA